MSGYDALNDFSSSGGNGEEHAFLEELSINLSGANKKQAEFSPFERTAMLETKNQRKRFE